MLSQHSLTDLLACIRTWSHPCAASRTKLCGHAQQEQAAPHHKPWAATGVKPHCFETDLGTGFASTHSPKGFPELGAMDTPAPRTSHGDIATSTPAFPLTVCAPPQLPSHRLKPGGSHVSNPLGLQGEMQAGLEREDGGARRSEPSRDPAACSVIIRLVCFYLKYYPLTSPITKVAQQYRQTVNINRSV